jgi:anaerobic ribonucleoside-triphosphate reductase
MHIQLSYEQEFNDLIFYLQEKYPKELFNLEGIGDQLDMPKYSKKFFSQHANNTTVADNSVDANANVSDMSVISYVTELVKPFERLNSMYMLWKYSRQFYNTQFANMVVESQLIGDFYINDFHHFFLVPYCFNYSTYDIALGGLPYLVQPKCTMPKYLLTFKQQMEQFTVFASNTQSGAAGQADLLIIMSYFVKQLFTNSSDMHFKLENNEENLWAYVKDILTTYIYTINQPFRSNQSPFTNVSVYDKYFLENLCKDIYFADGSKPDINIINKLQKIFIDIMNEELERTPITYPVTTACFNVDKEGEILDKTFLKMISEKNLKWGFINLYTGSSSTLSSCCFDKNQKVLTRSSDGVKLTTIKEVVDGKWEKYRKNFTIFHNGSWVSAKKVKIKNINKLYKIRTSNNKELLVTDNHIHPTINGDIETKFLSTNDYLAFNSRPLSSFPEKNNNLTYEQGFLLGMYIGDGSKYKRKTSESYEVTFSLNESNLKDIPLLKKALDDWNIKKDIHINKAKNNVMFVKIYCKELFDIVSFYILGNYAHEKSMNLNIFEQEEAFRRGIVDGWYASDGGNSNRIYTTSTELTEQGEALFTSLGINTIINILDRNGENEVIIRGKKFNRNYPLNCIRWYDMKNKRTMRDVYKIINNTEYFKITSIEKYESLDDYVYCFEINNDEPYFTLPNGIITHNCRLRSESTNEYFNSFGAGSTKIGSLGVVTLNLPRAAIKSNGDKNKLIKEVERLTEIACKINNIKRHILKQRIDNGNLPLYTYGYMELNKQYSTTGVNGLNETLYYMSEDILNESGQELQLNIIQAINKINDKMSKIYKVPTNAEQTPSENSAIKLCKKDHLLKYQDDFDIYSNQFIPLTTNADMLDRIILQGKFDKEFSGGAICHINVENKITKTEDMENLIIESAKKGVVYFAINYNLQKCKNGHMSVGKLNICPICSEVIIENYTRVVGFLTNVKNWNKTRRVLDYPNREFYKDIETEK